MQPWVIDADPVKVTVSVAAEHTSTMDAGFRGSAVAVGAALFNIRVAAAARGVLGPVSVVEDVGGFPLQATMTFGNDSDPGLAELYDAMLTRGTNRLAGRLNHSTAR